MVRVAESKTRTSRVKVSWSSSCIPHCGTSRRRKSSHLDLFCATRYSMMAEPERPSRPQMLLQDLAGSDTGKPAVCAASAPFDDASADTVLRTSDNVDFRVFRWFLKGISSVFDDLLAHPQVQPQAQTNFKADPDMPLNPRAILRVVSEPSQILDPLLRQYYPFPGPLTFLSYKDTMSVLLAAHRLQLTRIAQTLADAARPHIKENPPRAYGFALRHGMEDTARLAAHEFLAVEDTLMDSDELDSLTVRQYRQLVVYRQACIAVLKIFHGDTMDENGRLCVWTSDEMAGKGTCTWFQCTSYVQHYLNCKAGDCRNHHGPARWFREYYERMGARLGARPSADAVRDLNLLVPAIQAALRQCRNTDEQGCTRYAYTQLHRYRELMLEEIERVIAEVPLELVWRT
ncbi:hypothetical protein OH76DRAFT_1059627 [Lentinus brumalis]|uniref:BTB domain-containing protein n=1 Tax=Lentinus brumalis TaxID=2498619 RepID=A0A371DNF9_9APHY|nr:hypothetical protein OH76DRAFT_1059627 [Polyporus brumalis]